LVFILDVNFYGRLMIGSTMLPGIFMGMVGGKLAKGSIAGGVPDVFLLVIIGWVLHKRMV
jgi:hypothetical protein